MKRQIFSVIAALSLLVSVNLGDENSNSSPNSSENSQNSVNSNANSSANSKDIRTYELEATEITGIYQVDENPTVTQISAQEFKESGAVDLGQAVSRSAGVYFREGVGSRARASLYVRGYDSSQIGFYMDGISIKSIYGGGVDTSFLSLGGVSSVSIERGFTSPVYAMNSLGAAINMTSARPEKEFEFVVEGKYITSEGRQGAEWQYGLSIGTKQRLFYIKADYFQRDRDTYGLSNNLNESFDGIKGYVYNGYFHSKTLRLKVGFTPNESNEYSLNYLISKGSKGGLMENGYSLGNTSYLGVIINQYPIYDQQIFYLLGLSYFTPDIYLESKIYYRDFGDAVDSTTTQEAYDNVDTSNEKYTDESYGIIETLNFDIHKKSNLKLGANINYSHHYKTEALDTNNDKTNYFRNMNHDISEVQSSIFAQYAQGLWGGFRFMLAGSVDRADTMKLYADYDYGGGGRGSLEYRNSIKPHFSYQGILFYDFAENNTLHLNIGRKHNLPSLAQRYGSEMAEYAPNPDLEPESAINYELGYDLAYKSTNLSLAVFYNDMTNMIDNTATGSAQVDSGNCAHGQSWQLFCYMQRNIDHGYTYGGEVSFQQGFGENDELTFGVNYSYIYKHAEGYEVNLRAGTKITDYPNHIVNGKIKIKATQNLDIIAQGTYQSAPFYANLDTSGTDKTGGYFRDMGTEYINFDISAFYRATKHLTINTGIYNVADRDNYKLVVPSKAYRSDTPYVAQHYAGRRFFVGAEWRY